MSVYLVSYDLNRPGQEYEALWSAIQSYPRCCHALKSQWFVCSDSSAEQICKHLRGFIDEDDFLFVSEVTADRQSGWLADDVAAWLKTQLLSQLW